jgi:hypothetical protein
VPQQWGHLQVNDDDDECIYNYMKFELHWAPLHLSINCCTFHTNYTHNNVIVSHICLINLFLLGTRKQSFDFTIWIEQCQSKPICYKGNLFRNSLRIVISYINKPSMGGQSALYGCFNCSLNANIINAMEDTKSRLVTMSVEWY